MMNISSRIKAVFFDFDVLVVHQWDDKTREEKKGTDAEFDMLLDNPEEYYETFDPCKPNPDIEEVLKWCFLTGRKVYSMNVSGTSAEEAFVRKYYGNGITMLPVAGYYTAAEYVRRKNGLKPHNVLYVSNDAYDRHEMQVMLGFVAAPSDENFLVDNVPISEVIKELGTRSTWYRKLKHGKVYGIPLADGVLRIDVSPDPEYPGIDIEYVRDDEKDGYITRPRVVVEAPGNGEHGVRALIWGDPCSEDYSKKVEFPSTQPDYEFPDEDAEKDR